MTALAGAEPLVQAQAAEVQRLQFFLSEATWNAEAINARRLALLAAEPATAPSAEGVLVIDDTGDRKDGSATDHVARQYLGSVGKIDDGIVAVTTLWAGEERYYPLHVMPYTPGKRLTGGKLDPGFRTKPQIALALVEQAQAAGIAFSAIVADCFYGDHRALEKALLERRLPHVLARRGAVGRGRVPAKEDHSFADAAEALPLRAWQPVIRRFRDGHAERWWAAELTIFGYCPDKAVRAVCATTDRRALPSLSTWYLTTNLSAPLEEIVRLYGLRNWVEQSYKQMEDELGWALLLVRRDRAIRRHWTLVCCAFLGYALRGGFFSLVFPRKLFLLYQLVLRQIPDHRQKHPARNRQIGRIDIFDTYVVGVLGQRHQTVFERPARVGQVDVHIFFIGRNLPAFDVAF